MTLNRKILDYAERSGKAAGRALIEYGTLPKNRLDHPDLQEYADAWRSAMLAEIEPTMFAEIDHRKRAEEWRLSCMDEELYCGTCGTQMVVTQVDVSDAGSRDRKSIPGLVRCPNHQCLGGDGPVDRDGNPVKL